MLRYASGNEVIAPRKRIIEQEGLVLRRIRPVLLGVGKSVGEIDAPSRGFGEGFAQRQQQRSVSVLESVVTEDQVSVVGRRIAERGVAPRLPFILELVETAVRSEEHTSELQSLMRISYAVFCLKT